MASRNFGKQKSPRFPHLSRSGGGLRGNVHDLRQDIDEAFSSLETAGLLSDPAATSQLLWYVDGDTGDDTADGTSWATALRTLTGLMGRLRDVQVKGMFNSFVYVRGDMPDSDENITINPRAGGTLSIEGQPTTLYTGSITGFQVWDANPAGGVQEGLLSDSALSAATWAASGPGGSSLVHKRIVLTSGANAGAFAWVIGDTGVARECRVSQFIHPDTWTAVTADLTGETFRVEKLPRVPRVVSDGYYTYYKNFRFFPAGAFVQGLEVVGNAFVVGCHFDGPDDFTGPLDLRRGGTLFDFNCFKRRGVIIYQGEYLAVGGALYDSSIMQEGGLVDLQEGYIMPMYQNAATQVNVTKRGGTAVVRAAVVKVKVGTGTHGGVWEFHDNGHLLLSGTVCSIGGTTGFGLWFSAVSHSMWAPSNVDVNTKCLFASASDFYIGGDTKTIADLNTVGYVKLANGSCFVPGKYDPAGA